MRDPALVTDQLGELFRGAAGNVRLSTEVGRLHFAAGGPTDVVARAFAEHAARALGQPLIVDNKPGANTVLAAESVDSAPADAYTLLLGATNHTLILALYSARVKFDAVRSFVPVCTLAASPTVLVVGPSMKVTTAESRM